MKTSLLIGLAILLIPLIACSSSQPTDSPQETQTTTSKKITLDDAQDILDISSILTSNFEELDAASEGLSNKDLELGSDASEVYVFFSENEPFQLIYHYIGITESRVEAASFDNMIDDEEGLETMLINAVVAGAEEEGMDVDLPNISLSHPQIGDKAISGTGRMESYGFMTGLDVIFFRINKVYYFGYSVYWSTDKLELTSIAKELEVRINNYSQ